MGLLRQAKQVLEPYGALLLYTTCKTGKAGQVEDRAVTCRCPLATKKGIYL